MRLSIVLGVLICLVLAGKALALSLEDEAGISAYVKLNRPIDLNTVKSAFKSINHETDTYVWGMLNIEALTEEMRPWAYVSSDGWIFVYLPKEFGRAGIYYNGQNNLERGIKKICTILGYSDFAYQSEVKPNIKYYDFEFPQASEMYVFYERTADYSNTLKLFIDSNVTWYRVEYAVWATNCPGSGNNWFKVDGTIVKTNIGGYTTGVLPNTLFTKGLWHTLQINGCYRGVHLIIVIQT